MKNLSSFSVIIKFIGVSFLVDDFTDIALAIEAIDNCVAIGIRRTCYISCIIIGVCFTSTFCRLDFLNLTPKVITISCLILVTIFDSYDSSFGIVFIDPGCFLLLSTSRCMNRCWFIMNPVSIGNFIAIACFLA